MRSYRQYRAPIANDRALVDPSWRELVELITTNRRDLGDATLGGLPLSGLAAQARSELLTAAAAHTSAYADVGPIDASAPVVLSGHQPELFHPGVWFKNFGLDTLAKSCGGVGVHLLIDSDLCRTPSIRVPTGSVAAPRVESVAFDSLRPAMPYEERETADAACFASFAERVTAAIEPLVREPLATELWREAEAARTPLLGRVLSEARHRLERRWGSATFELPSSQVADTEPFRRFAAETVLRADESREAYNASLAGYRSAHRIRTAAQPLPDLADDGGWIETPLWVWSADDPTRRALFARVTDGVVTITDRTGWQAETGATADAVVALLADLRSRSVKVRSRALATTLYCRLVLADLFLHGIGGAKYDQVTDAWCERLLGVTPPPHATLTATLRLPIDHHTAAPGARRELCRKLRDLRFHPEGFSPSDAAAVEQKRRWIATPKTPDNAAERHAAIVEANARMAASLGALRSEAEAELAALDENERAAAVLDSREYSFCLFPADDARRRLTSLARWKDHDA